MPPPGPITPGIDPTERGGYTTTVTANGITTLTSASKFMQFATGTNAHVFQLPVASTLSLGFPFLFVNRSTQTISVTTSSGAALSPSLIIQPGGSALAECILLSGTTSASWNVSFDGITLEMAQLYADSVGAASAINATNAAAAYTDSQIVLFSPKVLFDNITPVASTSTNGTEDDLFSNPLDLTTIIASIVPGVKILESEVVTTVGSATASRRIKKYAGANLIWDSGALTLAVGSTFFIQTLLIVDAVGKANVIVSVVTTSASTVPYSTFTPSLNVDFTGADAIKTTGIASGVGAGASDIVNKMATITFIPPGATVA